MSKWSHEYSRVTVEAKYVQLGDAGKLECVDRFCYLGDMLCSGGGVGVFKNQSKVCLG